MTMEIEAEDAEQRVQNRRAHLMSRVFATIENDFHEESRTHICFNRDVGPTGIKGFGDYPNEAYEQFQSRLAELASAASPKMVERWIESVEVGAAERKTEARLEALVAIENASGQKSRLKVVPNKPALEKVESLAAERGESISRVAAEVLALGVRDLVQTSQARDEFVDRLRSSEAKRKLMRRAAKRGTKREPKRLDVTVGNEVRAQLKFLSEDSGKTESLITCQLFDDWGGENG
ncbi:MAG: hypothetical protein AB8G23_24820 [Myxococcota bacterium]